MMKASNNKNLFKSYCGFYAFFWFIKMKGLEMVKCKSLRINMLRITHTGKSVNFPVTPGCRYWYRWMFTISSRGDFLIFCRVIWRLKNIRNCLLLMALLTPLQLYHRCWRMSKWYPWAHQGFGNMCKYSWILLLRVCSHGYMGKGKTITIPKSKII